MNLAEEHDRTASSNEEKAIQEYFKKHPTNQRKLMVNEWIVTSEACSLLDPVADVTARIQGKAGGILSQSILQMTAPLALLEGKTQSIRPEEARKTVPPLWMKWTRRT